MDFFEEAALRLKQQLKVKEDKEVAAFLGISASALNMRKKRGNFPEKELYALAAKRPDLNLDVHYVLTGITREAHTQLQAGRRHVEDAAAAGLSHDEIRAYALAVGPGPTPERKALFMNMLNDLRVAEFEALFVMAQSIVGLRAALAQPNGATEGSHDVE